MMASPWDGAELDAAFGGSMAPFRGRLGIGPPPDGQHTVGVQALMTPAHLAQVRRFFDAAHGATDARVVASIWSKWHFAIVMPAWFIGRVLMGRRLPTALDGVSFDLDAQGRTLCLRLPAPGDLDQAADDPDTSWHEFLHKHLVPFVEQMAARTGVTRRVLWSNAGNLFEAFIRRLDETHPGLRGLAPAREWLEMPTPLHRPVIYLPRAEGVHRMRRICCMRYLVPDRVFCTTCPSPLLNASNSACRPP